MEHEIKFEENTTKLIRAIRAKVSKGQYANRELLLAYAFLKDRPYASLEQKIHEDHESFGVGRNTFLKNLAYGIGREIFHLDNKSEMQCEVQEWVMKKYETSILAIEKAA